MQNPNVFTLLKPLKLREAGFNVSLRHDKHSQLARIRPRRRTANPGILLPAPKLAVASHRQNPRPIPWLCGLGLTVSTEDDTVQADAPIDVNAIAQFCQRGTRDCDYATDQMLLELAPPRK